MSEASAIIAAAQSQLGVPYSWGGETAGQGFDCSGLVQWAFQQAGITLPRTSEEQYSVTTPVPANAAVPGDLVFGEFGAQGQSGPGHVGIYLGNGMYIDAPYTGVPVQVNQVPSGWVFGRVANVTANVTDTSSTASTQPASTVSYVQSAIPGIPATPPANPGIGLDPISSIGSQVEWLGEFAGWALLTMIVFMLGSVLMLLGLVMLIMIFAGPTLGQTGQAVGKVASFIPTPAGKAAKVAGGLSKVTKAAA